MDWIEKYDLNFQLHIKEEDGEIFDQLNSDEVIDNILDYNDTIVDVASVSKVNDEYYYKIKYKSKLIGWFKPGPMSIKYLRTKKQEVKLLNEHAVDNELNRALQIDTEELTENWVKIFTSDFYAVFNEKLYCGILLKSKLLGFVQITDASFFVNFRKELSFTDGNVNLYKDSKLEKVIIENFDHGNKTFRSLGGFEGFDGVRVIVDGKRYWTSQKNTDLSIDPPRIENLNDLVIDVILYQMKDKLEKQHEFYTARIDSLKEKNREMVQREKHLKQSLKKFREIL